MKQDRTPRRMGKGATDLWAGVAATITFLLLASWLGIGWLTFSVLVSAVVYGAIRLLMPAPKSATPAPPAIPLIPPETLLRELRERHRTLPPPLASHLAQIVSQAERLLAYFQAHPERSDPALSLTRQHLQMAHTVLGRWQETARSTPHLTPQSAQKLAEFLSNLAARLSQLYQGLLQADDAHLAGEIEALTRTMKEMDEVYQRIGGGSP